MSEITPEEVETLYQKLKKDAEDNGYNLNADAEFSKELCSGLIVNEKRYGYPACPCRLAKGDKSKDLDIICPCDYRDYDLFRYGACYCGLYVSKEVLEGKKTLGSIPESRQMVDDKVNRMNATKLLNSTAKLPLPVYRCKVCGYLCAREEPPEVCPICKAKKERFERFM